MLSQKKRQKISYTLVYNRQSKMNRLGKALIQIRTYQNPKCRYFSTNIYIKPQYWDNKKGQIKPNQPNEFIYTEQINNIIKEMKSYENKIINRYGTFPLERLHEYQEPEGEFKNFTDFYLFELDRPDITNSTKKSQKARLTNLNEFRKGKIYFEDLTYTFILKFDRFLRTKYNELNSTIPNVHKTVKAYINKAIEQDLIKTDKNPYKKFKIKSNDPEKVFLTEGELKKIEDLTFNKGNKNLERIKDFFLLCCYTGFRYSDVNKLAPIHLVTTKEGVDIRLTTKKNKKPALIPTSDLFLDENGNSKVVALIEKLQQQRGDVTGEFAETPFLKLANQYVNRELKKIAQLAGITKNLTTHVGRHTNATILCTKVPLPVLQKMLTHSNIDTTMQYIHMNGDLIRNEIKKAKW